MIFINRTIKERVYILLSMKHITYYLPLRKEKVKLGKIIDWRLLKK